MTHGMAWHVKLSNGLQTKVLTCFPLVFNRQKALMEKFEKQSMPKACKNLEKFLEKNPKDEVYCVGNKVSYLGILFYDEENYFIVIG